MDRNCKLYGFSSQLLSSKKCGSALLLAFWAVAILTIAILGTVQIVEYRMDETIAFERTFRAKVFAESGVAFGIHPQIKKYDLPLLNQKFGNEEGFNVHFESEAGKLQINFLLLTNRRSMIRTVFYRWGLSLSEADEIIDQLLNWKRENGGNRNANRLFQSVEEMSNVTGMSAVEKKNPLWRNAFTVWTDGKVDVNAAPPEIIEAVCGVSSSRAQSFCNYRLGPDQKADTTDDLAYTSVAAVQAKLGLSDADFAKVLPLITLDSPIRRVESRGFFGKFEHKIDLIVRMDASPPQYLEWHEE